MTLEKLNQAVQLIKAGNKAAALPLLKKIVQTEPNNENAWLWLHSCVESIEQKKYCLQQAIRINPTNQNARNALLKLESLNPPLAQSAPTNLKSPHPKQMATPKNSPKKKPVSGGILIALIFLSITLLAGCGLFVLFFNPTLFSMSAILPSPTTSPDKRYADSVTPAMDSLVAWQSGYTDFQILLNEPIKSNEKFTRLLILGYYNIAAEVYMIDRELYQHDFAPLDDLVTSSAPLIDNGYQILNVINIVTPANEIESAHIQVVKCMQLRISILEELSSSISTWRPVNLNHINNTRDCDTFDAAVAKLVNFVQNNK